MHSSAYAHMRLCVEHYLQPGRHYRVVDLGACTSPGQVTTHRALLRDHDVEFLGVDVQPGDNVDLVMAQPYTIPLPSGKADLVLSGQAFEHIPFFWASFLEMARVLRRGGLLFLTAPSRGHVHDLYDCWRFYPDGMRALAAFAQLELLEAHTDFPPPRDGRRHDYAAIDAQRAYWGDSVAVFRKPRRPPSLRLLLASRVVRWWANRAGDLGAVPAPEPLPARRRITGS